MFKFASRTKYAGGSCGVSTMSGGGGAGGGGGGSSGTFGSGQNNGGTLYNPIFDDLSEGTIVEQFMPVDPRRLHRIWRRIYLQDPIAGPAIELMRDIPWSSWEITGCNGDATIRKFYEDAFNAIGAVALMPELTGEFLSMGKYIAHLIFDDQKGFFTHCIVQDPDFVKIGNVPIPGWQPNLDLIPTPEMRAWATSQDPRNIEIQDLLGPYTDDLRSGKQIPLLPENTIYVARRTAPYDNIGASIFTRILMFVAYEKALVNATISTAKRRAARIRHIKVGIDDVWDPEPHTIQEIADAFMNADTDPVGAIVATRTGVETSEVGGNTLQDIIKISDEWEFIQKGKMSALGISDAFLSGEATYNSMEQLVSVFLDRMRALRAFHVHHFLDEIAKRLARKHEYVKRTEAELRHGVRIGRSRTRYGTLDYTDDELILPGYAFSKTLRPVADRDYMDILEQLRNQGVPVTAADWMASAGYDVDNVSKEALDEDLKMRKRFSAHNAAVAAYAPDAEAGEGGGGGSSAVDFGGGGDALDELGLGGDEGGVEDALGDLGGGEEPAGGEEGGGEAPVKASSFVDPAVQAVTDLPLWTQQDRFLGVDRATALQAAKKVVTALGRRQAGTLTTQQVRTACRTGNAQRDQVVQYVLCRAGLLKNVKIGRDVAEDVARELCDRRVAGLVDELAWVQAMTFKKSTTPQIEKKGLIRQLKTPAMPGGSGKLIATGFTTEPKILKA